jgi:hypothetical protein
LSIHLAFTALAALMLAGILIHSRTTGVEANPEAFWALLAFLLLGSVWIVLWQIRFGQHYADERNWPPALMLAGARAGGLVGMGAVAVSSYASPLTCGFGLMVGTWSSLILCHALLHRPLVRAVPAELNDGNALRRAYRTNLNVFAGFAVWSLGTLIIQYGLPPVVAIIAPARFNAFFLASTLNMIAIGAIGAAMSALLAPLSRWQATGDGAALRRIALAGPLFCGFSCLTALLIAWFGIGPLLQILSTKAATVGEIHSFLAVMGLQTIVRTAALGYSVCLASTGSIRQMSGAIVLEVVITFCVGAPLGWLFGPEALLWGLVLAGFASSLYTASIGLSLMPRDVVSKHAAFATLVLAQIATCGLFLEFQRL